MFRKSRAPKPGRFHRTGPTIRLVLAGLLLVLSGPAFANTIWGANGHPFTAYAGISADDQLDALRRVGLTDYRVNIASTDSIPRLAELVSKARSRGIRILPVVTPPLDLDKETADDIYRKSYDLAFALVSRFKDDIRVWELGNELENYAIIQPCEMMDNGQQYNCAWGPAGGVGKNEYFGPRWRKVSAELRGLSDATVAVDPTIRKAIGTAGWGHFGAFNRMRDDGVRWDITVWHYYQGDPGESLKMLQQFDRPIWVTEFNASGGSTKGEQAQADGLRQMMTYLKSYGDKYRVEAAFIYELLDEPYWEPSSEARMGLYTLKSHTDGEWAIGRPKKAAEAVASFLSPDGEKTLASAGNRDEANPKEPFGCKTDDFEPTKSNEANQVVYAYCLILHRPPTPSEQWSDLSDMKKKPGIGTVIDALLDAANAKSGYLGEAKDDADYITRAFKLLLRREPDGQGMKDYLKSVKGGGMTRRQVSLALAQSDEFRSQNPVLFPPAKK